MSQIGLHSKVCLENKMSSVRIPALDNGSREALKAFYFNACGLSIVMFPWLLKRFVLLCIENYVGAKVARANFLFF